MTKARKVVVTLTRKEAAALLNRVNQFVTPKSKVLNSAYDKLATAIIDYDRCEG